MTKSEDALAKARAHVTDLLIERASADQAFRELLKREPKAAIKSVLGVDPLPGHTIRVIEEQPGEICLVLPQDLGAGELPDSLLDLASGGISFSSFILYGDKDAPQKPKK